ncbi:MAG: alpha-glucosidase [Treponema sp.]|nr:alpha-glucosidase [Treponema sp.]
MTSDPSLLQLISDTESFKIIFDGKEIISHSCAEPFVYGGSGTGKYRMFRGNFHITEHVKELAGLADWEVLESDTGRLVIRFSRDVGRGTQYRMVLTALVQNGRLELSFTDQSSVGAALQGKHGKRGKPNRWRFHFSAQQEESVYGCGEQFSYFNLRGRSFPLWTSEQGVGRNKKSYVTWLADVAEGAGGDYYWTFFPQTSFVSSRKLWYYADCSAYSVFDFTLPDHHELYFWDLPSRIIVGSKVSMLETIQDQSAFFGRQEALPDWVMEGVILGIQGGTEICEQKLSAARKAGVPVAGIWAQDWEGIRITSFGQRLRWNWEWDQERYPNLDQAIKGWRDQDVRFLGYINPYVLKDHTLYEEAVRRDFLAKNSEGHLYLVDFGEFDAGIVDVTNPAAFAWYKGVIKQNLLDLGLSGWMADFGEYLPTDTVLYSGRSAELAHNEWPALWARCNYEAVQEWYSEHPEARGQIVYFMRAGGPGSQKWCPLMWAGDQNVDWSEDDGLPSVIPAALSLAMSGHGLHHSDIGGYTTLFGMKRTKELFMRWAEFAALTPVMRGHEGNRPRDNWQFDSDKETLAHLARMGHFHSDLLPYLRHLSEENASKGIPVMRPLLLHYEGDPAAYHIKDQYLLGPDLLVAPVLESLCNERHLHLPPGIWRHLWSGAVYESPAPSGTECTVRAYLGEPPVFCRAGSPWEGLFVDAAKNCASYYESRPTSADYAITVQKTQ